MAERTDDELWTAFVAASLPSDEWTHRAHVRVAWMHLRRHAFADAVSLVRQRIQALNRFHQTPEAIDRGYHETITIAFLTLIEAATGDDRSAPDSSAFLARQPALLDKRILLQFYSREQLLTAEAKGAFVPPDQVPLPQRGRNPNAATARE
jgi:hypothetical protein